MIKFPRGLFPFLLGIASGLGACAQNIDAGPFLGVGTTYFVKDGTRDTWGALVPFQQCYTKKCGRVPGGSSGPPVGRPQFTFAAMFPDPSLASGIADIEIDAISIGADILWVDPDQAGPIGQINSAVGTWLALSVSVRSNSTTTTGTIGTEAANDADGIGADVFTYIPISSNLPPGYAGQVFRSLDGTDLDLDTPTGMGWPRPEITALDNHIEAYYLDNAFVSNNQPPTVYFSVTDGTKTNVPPAWRTYGGAPLPPPNNVSGAYIYQVAWNTVTNTWGTPEVWLRPSDLGLTNMRDIDALAIDVTYDPDLCVVYSTVNVLAGEDELMFWANTVADGTLGPVPYKDSDGQTVTSKLGTGTSVNAVCGSDPGPQQNGLRRFLWGSPVPFSPLAIGAFAGRDAWIGAFRSCYAGIGGAPTGKVESFLSGWRTYPPPGGFEFAVYAVTFEDPAIWGPPSVIVVHDVKLRMPAPDWVEQSFIDYPALHPNLYGMDLYSFWACLNATSFYRSDVTRIRI